MVNHDTIWRSKVMDVTFAIERTLKDRWPELRQLGVGVMPEPPYAGSAEIEIDGCIVTIGVVPTEFLTPQEDK